MKTSLLKRLLRPALALPIGFLLSGPLGAAEESELSPAVKLQRSETGSSCVMVFATVGEQFRFDFSKEGSCSTLKCAPGVSASGQKSELPAGLGYDSKERALVGVPQRPGFHEYVVLRTEKGVTSEQVVLIDIQGHSFASGGMDYASYFAGGLY